MSARRTVSVALEVKAADARRDIRGASGDVRQLEASVVATGRGLDKMSEKASKAGRGAEKAAAGTKTAKVEAEAYKRELGSLDRQIDATVLHLKALGREFVATGDRAVLGRIKAERSMLRQLEAMRKNLMPAADGSGIGATLGALPSQLRGAGIAAVAALLPLLLPTIGAAVGGAVLGGAGAGGIIGGIAAAGQDPRVKAAAAHFGQSFMADFASAGTPFVAPLVRSLGELEDTGAGFTSTLHRGFTQLAPVIGPVTKGIDGLVRGLDRGLDSVFSGPAQKAIRALSNELPEIGNAIDDALSAISDNSDGATMGLIGMLHAVEDLVRGGGEFIGWLSGVFEWTVRVSNAFSTVVSGWLETFSFLEKIPVIGNALGLVRGYFEDARDETYSLIDGLGKASDATGDWNTKLRDLRDTTEEEAAALANFNDEIEKYLGKTLGVEEAQIRLKRQWADTVETLKDGKRTLDINTKAGQDNKQALLDMIKAADDVRVAEYNKTGSLDAANAAYDRQLTKLRDMAVKLGFDKTKVDELIDSVKTGNAVGGLTVPVTMPGLNSYINRLNYFIQQLGIAKGLAAAEFATYREGERNPSGNRWGGVYEHAAVGTLREASYYSAANPGRYMIAEPATQGEAFVPKRGDYGRSMSILSQAAGWYGASVVPGGGAPQVRVFIGSRELTDIVRVEVSESNRGTSRRVMSRTGGRR